MVDSKRPAHFLEVFLPRSSDRLKVPTKFTRHMEGRTSGSVMITGPSGNSWKVELITNNTNLYLHDGWSVFVRDHSIQSGDSLVFRYDGNLRFSVLIFDEGSCEKEDAFYASCSQQGSCGDGTVASGVKRELEEEPGLLSVHDGMIPSKMRRIFPHDHLGSPIRMMNLSGQAEDARLASYDEVMQDRPRRAFWPAHLALPSGTMGLNLEMGKCGGSKEVMGMIMEENHQWSSSFDDANRFERATKHIVEDQRVDRMKAVYASTGESNQNMKLLMLGHRTGGAEHGNPKKAMEGLTSLSSCTEKATGQNFTSNFPYFVKVMKHSNISGNGTLKIPVQFSMAHFPKFRTKIDICNLRGDRWSVSSIPIVRSRTLQHNLCGGWTTYVRDNGIKMGNVCIFELVGDCEFCVRVLHLGSQVTDCHDEEGGSDVSPVGSADLSSKSETEMVQNGNGDSDWRDKLNEGGNAPSGMSGMTEAQGAIPLSCYPRSETIPWNTSFSRDSCPASFTSNGRTGYSIGGNHDENNTARPRGMNDGSAGGTSSSEGKLAAVSFTSSFPNFMKVMKYSDTKGPYILHIPCKFSSAYFPNCKIEVVLRNLKGQSWIVNSMPVSNKTTRHMFCGGWSAFVRENGIKSGDSCVFELIGERELRVHIFGVGHERLEHQDSRAVALSWPNHNV
ncbi:B3 domain-containing protein [Drosera capensis]